MSRRLFPRRWIEQARARADRGLPEEESNLGLRPVKRGGRGVIARLTVSVFLGLQLWACAGGADLRLDSTMRDFPPLEDPARPAPAPDGGFEVPETVPESPESPDTGMVDLPSRSAPPTQFEDVYRLGVGDEIQIMVVAAPDFNRLVKVLPDGSITAPGAGTMHVLGLSAAEASDQLETSLSRLLRYPDVDLLVTAYGEHVVYVMGEVNFPGDHVYRKGMSVLQALGSAGGLKDSGKRNSILVFRRTGLHEAELHKIDLKDSLKGLGTLEGDLFLRPYDIVFVPKTWIADVNVFVDQYFRQNLSALTFYLAGWDAYSVTKDRVVITRENR